MLLFENKISTVNLGKGWISIWSKSVGKYHELYWKNRDSLYLCHRLVSTQAHAFAAATASAADFFARHPWLTLKNRGNVLETQPEILTTSQPPLSGCETAQRYLHEINENLSHVQPCHGQRFTVADACSIWPCSPHLQSLTVQIHHHGLCLIMDDICRGLKL